MQPRRSLPPPPLQLPRRKNQTPNHRRRHQPHSPRALQRNLPAQNRQNSFILRPLRRCRRRHQPPKMENRPLPTNLHKWLPLRPRRLRQQRTNPSSPLRSSRSSTYKGPPLQRRLPHRRRRGIRLPELPRYSPPAQRPDRTCKLDSPSKQLLAR